MTKRKEIIVEKYFIFEKELVKFLDCDILPDIKDVDVCDIVFIITHQFLGKETKEKYEKIIIEMIRYG